MGDIFKPYTINLLEKNRKACPHCACEFAWVRPTSTGNYAEARCANADCSRWLFWVPKPKNENSTKRKDTKGLLEKFSRGFCEICLRKDYQLPRSEGLEAHHIIEKKDGGNEEKDNIQIVCTKCHKWIHHERTYLGHYHAEETFPEVDQSNLAA